MNNALFVLPFMPGSAAAQAGHRIAFDSISKASELCNVSVIVISNHVEPIPSELNEISKGGVNVITVSRLMTFLQWILFSITVYPRFVTRFSRSALAQILSIYRKNSFEYIRFEFSQTFIYGKLLKPFTNQTKIFFSAHDLQFQVVLRKASLERFLCPWTKQTESDLLSVADEVIVLSEKDKIIVNSILDVAVETRINPPSLSPFVYRIRDIAIHAREKNSLLFWGAMNRVENETATIDFIEKVFNPLQAKGYHFTLYIVGSKPSDRLCAYRSDRIIITGYISDPSEYFLKCSIGIVPLTMGAGIKLKTLEMLEAGIPYVIATPVGAEGVTGYSSRLILRSFDQFYDELVKQYVAFLN